VNGDIFPAGRQDFARKLTLAPGESPFLLRITFVVVCGSEFDGDSFVFHSVDHIGLVTVVAHAPKFAVHSKRL